MKSLERTCLLTTAALLGLALTAAPARAQQDEFNRPGPYLGVGGSYMVSGFQDGDGTASLDFGNTLGWNARGGYRFNEFFAAEGVYEYGDDFGAHQMLPGARIRTNAFSINGKLIVPLQRFQPYLMGGVGFLNSDADTRISAFDDDAEGIGFAGRFGGGVDLYATENVALYLDAAYTVPTGDVEDLHHFSFGWGAKYAF